MPGDDVPEDILLKGPSPEKPLKCILVGCGGTGCNLIAEKVVSSGMRTVALSSEADVIKTLDAGEKVPVEVRGVERDARAMVKGSGIHGTETDKRLGEIVKGSDITFIVAGLGGYTGGWSAVVASRAASRTGCLTVCIASEPFSVEGRGNRAREQLRLLTEHADAVLVLSNDMILTEAPNLPISKAFMVMNRVLASPIDLLSRCAGWADLGKLREVMERGRLFTMDVAEWDGSDAVFSVVEQLAESKWLALKDRNAASTLLFAEGDWLLDDISELHELMRRKVGSEAEIVIGKAGQSDVMRVTAMAGYNV